MEYHFFLHYGQFFQNLGKEAVRTFMHTTVVGLNIRRNHQNVIIFRENINLLSVIDQKFDAVIVKLTFPFHLTRCNIRNTKSFLYGLERHKKQKLQLALVTALTAEDFWFFCDLYLQFIAPINLWNKCIDLRLFSKYLCVPFLRSLRSPR